MQIDELRIVSCTCTPVHYSLFIEPFCQMNMFAHETIIVHTCSFSGSCNIYDGAMYLSRFKNFVWGMRNNGVSKVGMILHWGSWKDSVPSVSAMDYSNEYNGHNIYAGEWLRWTRIKMTLRKKRKKIAYIWTNLMIKIIFL